MRTISSAASGRAATGSGQANRLAVVRGGPAAIAGWTIAAVVLVQLTMVFTRAVNWDEFWFYVLVEQFRHGQITQPFQTFHVRLFGWLPDLPGSSIHHIFLARTIMLGCEIVTIGAIVTVARRFVEWPGAMVAGLAYVSAGFVMQHGFSFRTDPLTTACLMSALAVLAVTKLDAKWIAVFALLAGLATIVTIKVILYAPAFAGIAWMRWAERGYERTALLRLALCAGGAIAVFAVLFHLHGSGLPERSAGGGSSLPKSAASWAFFWGVPPYLAMLVKAIKTAPVLALAAACAPVAIWRSALTLPAKIALAGCWLPVLTPAFYINTAAYYYVFMLAPVAVACAVPFAVAGRRYGHGMPILLLGAMAVAVAVKEDRSVIGRQQLLVDEAQAILPAGSAYFDHDGMLPSYEKVNWLMTPSTLAGYEASGVPSFARTMAQRPVPMLLANWDGFDAVLRGEENVLLPEDEAALRGNYIRFWGPVWIAGRHVPAGASASPSEWLVPGEYRVEDAPVVIAGRTFAEGSRVYLARGHHQISAPEGAATLVWAEAKRPAPRWDEGDLYVLF